MYKVEIRYFGELCEVEKPIVDNEEIYELGEVKEFDNIDDMSVYIADEVRSAILEREFVVDEQKDNNIIRLFADKQENWNCYYEIVVNNYDLKTSVFDLVKNKLNIVLEINKVVKNRFEKVKREFIETENNNLIGIMDLLNELHFLLLDEHNVSNLDMFVVYENLGYFIDDIISIYCDSNLGTSYRDIEDMITEFIEDKKI